jgi:Ca2+-binding EF-hand superfamily protein
LLFKKYDADKSGNLSIEELKKMMYELREDKCIIGKIPNLNDTEIECLFDNWDKNADDKISW